MSSFRRLAEVSLAGQRVLIRADLNAPIDSGVVTNDARIRASLPTIKHVVDNGATAIVCSHLGRPQGKGHEEKFSLAPVRNRLSDLLDIDVTLYSMNDDATAIEPGQVALLENLRFHPGETKNNLSLAEELATLCDVFCLDAFGTAHRTHASTAGITKFAPISCAGLLLASEIDALNKVLNSEVKPRIAVVGGAKISGKIELLTHIAKTVDTLIVGGGMANTFLLAEGYNVGKSLAEPEFVDTAQQIRQLTYVPLPADVMVTPEIAPDASSSVRLVDNIQDSDVIADIGPVTSRQYAKAIREGKVVLWNGPMGVFEYGQFGEGTACVAEAITEVDGFSVAGGGDTLAAISKFGLEGKFGYVSTGGGAFLQYIEGKPLPAIEALIQANRASSV